MTSYWDSWQTIINKNLPESMFKDAISMLVDTMHEYDHDNGGHVVDNYCSGFRSLETMRRFLHCEEHTWYETERGLVKCLSCDFEAHPRFLAGIGIIV